MDFVVGVIAGGVSVIAGLLAFFSVIARHTGKKRKPRS